ncbi:MAG: DMT family transporter [Thermodesulfovibrionales bacterium]|nr:DMT family transporter [Thermodesulfovibrionales bacterium]
MTHLWIFYALISAFTLATSDALTKKTLRNINEYLVAWFRLVFTMPLLFLLFFWVPVPELDSTFFAAFLLALPLEVIALILYIKALHCSPLSLTLPFLSFTPLLLIVVSYIILGEEVSLRGGFGIFLLAAGSYTLNITKIRDGFWEPLKAIARERGSIFMIAVSILYSITSPLGKMAIEHSSPLFFGIAYFTALTCIFTPIALWSAKSEVKNFFASGAYKQLAAPGFFSSCMIISHMIAISLVQVAYMISVKRISILIGVMYGYIFFRETQFKERLLGALLMVAGFALIVIAS